MSLRPWHVMVCVVGLAVGLIAAAFTAGDRARELLLGLGVNLLSSCVFFVLLELYWRRQERVNGKEVHGFDYRAFARNVGRSRVVRVMGTFIYPLTEHPGHAADRAALLAALAEAVRRPGFAGVQFLFLHPDSPPAAARAAERKDDDVLRRMRECLATLTAFVKGLDADAVGRVEVRLFRRPPPFSLFQMDNFGSLSFYYRDRPISEVARYEFFLDSPLGAFVEKTFDDLWRDEQTGPLVGHRMKTRERG